MTLTLTIDNATEATRLLNDFCAATNYDVGSGKTKAEWTKERLAEYLKMAAKRGEVKTAAATINTAIDAIIVY